MRLYEVPSAAAAEGEVRCLESLSAWTVPTIRSAPWSGPRRKRRSVRRRLRSSRYIRPYMAGLGDSRPESVTVRAVHGYPAEELINAGADADMIVLGTGGVGGWSQQLIGSVATKVIHHAAAPVLIVPAGHS